VFTKAKSFGYEANCYISSYMGNAKVEWKCFTWSLFNTDWLQIYAINQFADSSQS